jgi:hypothetical protein
MAAAATNAAANDARVRILSGIVGRIISA